MALRNVCAITQFHIFADYSYVIHRNSDQQPTMLQAHESPNYLYGSYPLTLICSQINLLPCIFITVVELSMSTKYS